MDSSSSLIALRYIDSNLAIPLDVVGVSFSLGV